MRGMGAAIGCLTGIRRRSRNWNSNQAGWPQKSEEAQKKPADRKLDFLCRLRLFAAKEFVALSAKTLEGVQHERERESGPLA